MPTTVTQLHIFPAIKAVSLSHGLLNFLASLTSDPRTTTVFLFETTGPVDFQDGTGAIFSTTSSANPYDALLILTSVLFSGTSSDCAQHHQLMNEQQAQPQTKLHQSLSAECLRAFFSFFIPLSSSLHTFFSSCRFSPSSVAAALRDQTVESYQ